MTTEWLKNKEGERFYPVSHTKAVIHGNRTLDKVLEDLDTALSSVYTKEETDAKFTVKTQIDFDGANFKLNGSALNFKQLHDIHLDSPDFAFVVYGDRAYLLSYVQDDTSSMREMRWESVIAVTESNLSYTKTSGIYVQSSDGVNIASVRVTDINSENKAYKATAINDSNKASDVWYPSVKAVNDYISLKMAAANRKIDALIKVNEGQNYWFETVESTADTVTVPSGAKAASLNMLGGMSRPSKNILPYNLARLKEINTDGTWQGNVYTYKTVTYVINDDGSIVVNGTPNASNGANFFVSIGEIDTLAPNVDYRITGCPSGGDATTFSIQYSRWTGTSGTTVSDTGSGATIRKMVDNKDQRIRVWLHDNNVTADNLIFKPMITEDLSATYDDYEPYLDTLLDSKVDRVITSIAEKAIPQSVIDLCPDYGCGFSSTLYNHIDFENKKYYHKVGSVDLGALSWVKSVSATAFTAYEAAVTGRKLGQLNILMGKYNYTSDTVSIMSNKTYRGQASANKIYIRDDDCASASALKAALSGSRAVFELATTEVIDLSAVLPDDWNILEVTAGGSVQFHYPDKDNGFTLDVPSTMEYGVKLKEVIWDD